MAIIGDDIDRAGQILIEGGLVAIPTETVYGLAANAFNPEAIANVFEAKNRPSFDPLIVHARDWDQLTSFTRAWPKPLHILANEFWPGPLTLLLEKSSIIPDLVTSGMPRVAVRIPNHQLTQSLLSSLEFPLVAPSANPFGYISPTTANHVNDQLGDKLEYILDGGPCQVGIESTIIGMEGDQPVVYRLGGLDIKEIEAQVGPVEVRTSSSNPTAPGMLTSHYAPSKRVVVGEMDELLKKYDGRRCGIISYAKTTVGSIDPNYIYTLTTSNDLHEAAKNLFSSLRFMDQLDIDIILAEYAPNEGLGLAINDRLSRASS